MKKRGLGRGLDALLSQSSLNRILKNEVDISNPQLRYLPIEYLQANRYQPRKEFDAATLQELADSIRAQGIISPLIVRRLEGKENRYEIIAGERRWRAAQLAQLNDIPTLIKDISDQAALAIALIENIQRQDLTPIETALALQRLLHEFDMNHQQIAQLLGKSRSTISNLLRLLSLAPIVKNLLESKQLEMGHARALLSLEEASQAELAQIIVKHKLSVRATEQRVRNWQKKINFPETKTMHPDLQQLQQTLSDRLSTPVSLKQTRGRAGKGQLIIHYASLDILDGIIQKILNENLNCLNQN